MKFRNVHIKVPPDLFTRFSGALVLRGKNKTEVLLRLIEDWVDRAGVDLDNQPSNTELLERLKQLESKVKFLEKALVHSERSEKAVTNTKQPVAVIKKQDEWFDDTSDYGADFVLSFETEKK